MLEVSFNINAGRSKNTKAGEERMKKTGGRVKKSRKNEEK